MLREQLIKAGILRPTATNHDRPSQLIRLRRFVLDRKTDKTGVSGTGIVAEGVEFSDGTCVMNWLRHTRSTAIYANIKTLEDIHSHGGASEIKYID